MSKLFCLYCIVSALAAVSCFQSKAWTLPNYDNQLNHYELIRFQRRVSPHKHSKVSSFHIRNDILQAHVFGYGRHFRVVAFRIPTKHVNVKFRGKTRPHPVHHFQGRLQGRPDSFVHLYAWKGRLHGQIRDGKERFHLERLHNLDKASSRLERDIERSIRSKAPAVLMYRKRDLDATGEPLFSNNDSMLCRHDEKSFKSKKLALGKFVRLKECHMRMSVDQLAYEALNKDKDLIANEMLLLVLITNRIFEKTYFGNYLVMFRLSKLVIVEKECRKKIRRELIWKNLQKNRRMTCFGIFLKILKIFVSMRW